MRFIIAAVCLVGAASAFVVVPKEQVSIPMSLKQVATAVGDVPCPGGNARCQDGQTCCKTAQGWGCCPLPQAVCCSDMRHCCPHGTTCDLVHMKCQREEPTSTPMSLKQVATAVGDVPCPGGNARCQDGQTCCKTAQGWGCCPLPQAVCCSDMRHCCPHGTTCDLVHMKCQREEPTSSPMSLKQVATAVGDVPCPGGNARCQDGQTCCKTAQGWGCCPLPQAVCCSDMRHCCPHGTTCDLVHMKCQREEPTSSPMSLKQVATAVGDVPCPGGNARCQDGQTCCKTAQGWGCCPLPQAVCCSDMRHCCPHGTTCDLVHMKCQREEPTSTPMSLKQVATAVGDVQCPGGNARCQDGQTCCKTAQGWGCCPLPQAVCCSDMRHCCPHGTTCDLVHMKCQR